MLSQRMEEWAEAYKATGRQEGLELGIERGIERGIEKGIERGIAQGMLKGEARLLARLLQRRFGDLPVWVEQRLNAATGEQLAHWSDAVLDAASLAEVFAEPPANH